MDGARLRENVASTTTLSIARRIELYKAVEAGDITTIEALFQHHDFRAAVERTEIRCANGRTICTADWCYFGRCEEAPQYAHKLVVVVAIRADQYETLAWFFSPERIAFMRKTLASQWVQAFKAIVRTQPLEMLEMLEMLELLYTASASLFTDEERRDNLNSVVAYIRTLGGANTLCVLQLVLAHGVEISSDRAGSRLTECRTPDAVDSFTTEGVFLVGATLDTVYNADVARRLLERGGDPRSSGTVLHEAAHVVLKDVVTVLLREGFADVDARDSSGRTPLMRVVAHDLFRSAVTAEDRLVVAQLLLDAGADLTVKDPTGKTALHLAAGGRFPAVLETLLKRGANPNEADNSGKTVVDCVHLVPIGRDGSNMENLEQLLRYGADPNATSAGANQVAFVDRLMASEAGRAFVVNNPQYFTDRSEM